MRYAEHHLHTHFSMLDGVSTAEDYVKRAKEIGVEHITLTDHATLAGHSDMRNAGKKHGLSIGLGLEGYFSSTDRFDRRPRKNREDGSSPNNHMGVIAKNENGLKNLQALNRRANTEGFYEKPRFDFELLEEYHEDLIVLSGCMSGIVSWEIRNGRFDSAKQWAQKFQNLFGDDYYMEVMSHNDVDLTKAQFQIADDLGIKPIITSDCHHASPDDMIVQEAMLILSTGPKLSKDFEFSKAQKMDFLDRFNYMYPERPLTFEKYDLHLHTGLEHFKKMQAIGFGREDFIHSTIEIAEKIDEYPIYKGLDLLPKPDNDRDPDKVLWEMVIEGAKKLGTYGDPEHDARREEEMRVITMKNFSPYFIVMHRIDEWARSQGIRIGPGRGSAAGSLVCYELELTKIDPLPYNLLFTRFLDEFRGDWPDIDTDYQDDRRAEVKAFAKREFKHTGNIMTFTNLEGVNILKDAAKVLKIPYKETNDVSKNLSSWDDFLTNTSPKIKEYRKKYPEVEILGNKMRGLLRSVGMHAAGVVISSEPISDYGPVETALDPNDSSKDRVEVLAMDADDAAELGLIKYDFLGLTALTNIEDTINLVKSRYGTEIDIDKIDLDDKEVYQSITKKSTLGLFQLEGSAFTKLLDQMPIEEFNDLVAGTALARPGAANAAFGPRYLKARNSGRWKPYCEEMRDFTADTYGEILYQEQLMLTCTQVAGMSVQDSNKIRKIIGKKRDVNELKQYEQKFVDGAAEYLGGPEKALKMWENFKKSADYQFNKSHAVAYSIVTYQTAWLKHYYPAEFMHAILSREDDGIKRLQYLNECKRLDVRIKLPHVNRSGVHMEIHDDEKGPYLRMGLGDIKYVGPAAAKKLIAARPFNSFAEVKELSETKYSGVNVRNVEYMNMIGALKFDDNPLRGDEKKYYYECLNLPSFDTSILSEETKAQLRTMEEYQDEGTFMTMALVQAITRKNGWARADLFDETGTTGIFFNPEWDIQKNKFYLFLICNGSIVSFKLLEDIDSSDAMGKYLLTEKFKPFDGYRVIDFVTRKTKTGNMMGTLVVTDEDKRLEGFTVYSGTPFNKAHTLAQPGKIVHISATEKTYRGKTSYVLQDIK